MALTRERAKKGTPAPPPPLEAPDPAPYPSAMCTPSRVSPDASSLRTWKFLEMGNTGALPKPQTFFLRAAGDSPAGLEGAPRAPRAKKSGSPIRGARREPDPGVRKERREGGPVGREEKRR